jgi:hypothetical protein
VELWNTDFTDWTDFSFLPQGAEFYTLLDLADII